MLGLLIACFCFLRCAFHCCMQGSELQKVRGQKASDIPRHKKCRCPCELQKPFSQWGWSCILCVLCVRSQTELRQCSASTAMYLCIPHAPCMYTLCLPAFLPRVHGNKPVLCSLMIKCAITFCLIGCVFIRWSPDRQFGVARWLLWFAVYKLVWEVANISLPI